MLNKVTLNKTGNLDSSPVNIFPNNQGTSRLKEEVVKREQRESAKVRGDKNTSAPSSVCLPTLSEAKGDV